MWRKTSALLQTVMKRKIHLQHINLKTFDIKSNSEFASKVINGKRPVIVDFHANWCDPCRILTPKLIELINPLDKVDLAVVDVELNPELVDLFEVKAVPAIVVMSNGLVVDKFIGLMEAVYLENFIDRVVQMGNDAS